MGQSGFEQIASLQESIREDYIKRMLARNYPGLNGRDDLEISIETKADPGDPEIVIRINGTYKHEGEIRETGQESHFPHVEWDGETCN